MRTAAAVALLVTVALGTVSNLLFLGAFQFRRDWFDDPALMVAGGGKSAALLRWASVTDLFSYYLPTAVVALALGFALRPHGPVLARASVAHRARARHRRRRRDHGSPSTSPSSDPARCIGA
jgi:hypothetical protein